ncbi:hypothetical protein U8607_04295 [Methylobacterium durans]|uniref:hypothetical protein n=1 Tax=Methylobacterium durans TaxID=2202825 RepID=UPI002AFEBAF2|nr:hypothetical protein [Methylobacterium durans]MEA1831297.1 hypothetical protein [Methylobacterium durans]
MMQTLQIHDLLPSKDVVVDPRAVLTMLGERAIRASWEVAGVARYDEAVMIVGDEAADRLEALSGSRSRVSGTLLSELVHQTAQVIWGEFTAYEEGEDAPWVTVRAIDSSWCEVETDDEDVLDHVRRTFADVRVSA